MSRTNANASRVDSVAENSSALSGEAILHQVSWALSYPSATVHDHFKRMLTLSKVAESKQKTRA